MNDIKTVTRQEYDKVHIWLRKNYGRANTCEGSECNKKSECFQWAKKKGVPYVKVRENFLMLCRSCHALYDGTYRPRGELNGLHKLSDEDVAYIRKRFSEGGVTKQSIANTVGVSRQHVSRILYGQRRQWS